jgi:hypothetical protein
VPRRVELAILVAVVTAVTVWWTWGTLQPIPVVQDEYAYVLQSKIFAQGRWTVPPPPVPSSFQQPHVLTSPRVASKFPPGHALLLALGAVVGAPWLATLVLSGISAALIFLLAESAVGPRIALLCWAVWLGDPINLRFRPGYYSEVTAGLTWLASWWLLRRWYCTKQARWLACAGLVLGWMAITRPLSALAFAVPVGALVLTRAIRQRLWRHVVGAFITGSAVVAILPIWSVRTTGDWRLSPLTLYRRDYLPFDKPGFGLDSTPPALPLSVVNADVYAEFAGEHQRHSLRALPSTAVARVRALAAAEWSGWRVVLVPLAVIGLASASAELWFTVACAIALFIGYLSYAHWHQWTLYYFEAIPVAAFCTANGLATCLRWIERRRASAFIYVPEWLGVVVLAMLTISNIAAWRDRHVEDTRYDAGFNASVARAPFSGVVVFVRYAPDQHPHTTVVTNSATLESDRVWVVIDDPHRNAAVLRAANGRVPLVFEEKGSDLRVYESLIASTVKTESLRDTASAR